MTETFTVIVDSSNFSNPSNFDYIFNTPLRLEGKWQCGIVNFFTFNTVRNIKASYGNNKFKYSFGATNRTITILDGRYSLEDLNKTLREEMYALGDFALDVNDEPVYPISLKGNYQAGVVVLVGNGNLGSDITVDFTSADTVNLGKWLGFTTDIEITDGSTNARFYSDATPDVNLGRTAYFLRMDCIEHSYISGKQDDVILILQPNASSSAVLQPDIKNIIYYPLNKLTVSNIKVRFTSNISHTDELDLAGSNFVALLQFRKIN